MPTILIGEPVGESREAIIARVRQEAVITYTGQYQIECPLEIVEKALNHPILMGALWDVYGYAPIYDVKPLDEPGAIHVEDATGIVGDLWLFEHKASTRVYLARGKLDHWAVPALNGGLAVFDVEIVGTSEQTQVKVDVFIEPDSRIARTVLKVLEPLVVDHIDNRISLNLEDAAKIMAAIEQEPATVAERLEGEKRGEFDRVFY